MPRIVARMWARVHKLDRVRALPSGGALVVIEDERNVSLMQRSPSLSTLIAIARVLAARRALAAKFDGKGEIRYAATTVPSFLSDAVTRAGAAVATHDGERVIVPAQPAGVAAIIDIAFSELAQYVRGSLGIVDLAAALKHLEEKRRATPLDRDKQPELYWPAVFELSALAGEQARSRGGRWVDTHDLPVPFAIKFSEGAMSHPTVVAQKIVEGAEVEVAATDKSQP